MTSCVTTKTVRAKRSDTVSLYLRLLWCPKYPKSTHGILHGNPNFVAHYQATISWTMSRAGDKSTTADIHPSASCPCFTVLVSISRSASHAAISAHPTNFEQPSHVVVFAVLHVFNLKRSKPLPPTRGRQQRVQYFTGNKFWNENEKKLCTLLAKFLPSLHCSRKATILWNKLSRRSSGIFG